MGDYVINNGDLFGGLLKHKDICSQSSCIVLPNHQK